MVVDESDEDVRKVVVSAECRRKRVLVVGRLMENKKKQLHKRRVFRVACCGMTSIVGVGCVDVG